MKTTAGARGEAPGVGRQTRIANCTNSEKQGQRPLLACAAPPRAIPAATAQVAVTRGAGEELAEARPDGTGGMESRCCLAQGAHYVRG